MGKHNNEFAWDLYQQLKGEEGNLFFSPCSLRTALAMAYAGAKGQTAAQMERALRLTHRGATLHATLAQTCQELQPGAKRDCDLNIANSLWGQEGSPWLDEFLTTLRTYYGGGLNEVDFAAAPEEAREKINAWVENNTNRKIRDLIPPGGLDQLTRLLLVNAVWFRGSWLYPFEAEDTTDEPFYLNAAEQVTAPLMHRDGEGYLYAEVEGNQILELPYVGRRLTMVVMLPKTRDGLPELEAAITTEAIESWLERLRWPRGKGMDVYLPGFCFTWGTKGMKEALAALGMVVPFEPGKADLSGMNGITPPADEALYMSQVYHKAFVGVNEAGTEAAAATGVIAVALGACVDSPPPPVFRADHPFVFLIRDKVSGTILFLGRLVDPRA